MYTQVEKPKIRERAVANSVAQKRRDTKQSICLLDNQPRAITHRKLLELANTSISNSITTPDKSASEETNQNYSNLATQRKPVQKEGAVYVDDEYPDVLLEKLTKGVYKITSSGKYQNTLIIYSVEDGGYFYKDTKGDYIDYDRPFDISIASGGPAVEVPIPTMYNQIGEIGKGVGNVAKDTTLRTTGLVTCIGWLLYNSNAAYLTHIVVLSPKNVVANGGISRQINALSSLFQSQTGSAPTNVLIKVDEDQHAYRGDVTWRTGWMSELVPASCAVDWQRGDATLSHTVQAQGGERHEWNGPKIEVSIVPDNNLNIDKNGDEWTGANTLIPKGGVFEMEL